MFTGTAVHASGFSLATEAPTAPFAFCLPAAHHSNIKAAYKAETRQASLNHRCLTVIWNIAIHAVQVGTMLVLHQRTALGLSRFLGSLTAERSAHRPTATLDMPLGAPTPASASTAAPLPRLLCVLGSSAASAALSAALSGMEGSVRWPPVLPGMYWVMGACIHIPQ